MNRFLDWCENAIGWLCLPATLVNLIENRIRRGIWSTHVFRGK